MEKTKEKRNSFKEKYKDILEQSMSDYTKADILLKQMKRIERENSRLRIYINRHNSVTNTEYKKVIEQYKNNYKKYEEIVYERDELLRKIKEEYENGRNGSNGNGSNGNGSRSNGKNGKRFCIL